MHVSISEDVRIARQLRSSLLYWSCRQTLFRRDRCTRNLSSLKKLSTELAPRHGFEPRFTAPKAAVLPLDDRGMVTRRDSPSSVPVRSPLPQRQRPIIFAPAPYRYNEKRKAIWTGVRGGLQNRSAADEVAGVFDSHCLPPNFLFIFNNLEDKQGNVQNPRTRNVYTGGHEANRLPPPPREL